MIVNIIIFFCALAIIPWFLEIAGAYFAWVDQVWSRK